MEALSAVNKVAVEGFETVAQCQNEIIQEIVKEPTDAVGEMSKLDTPENAIAKQAELIKSTFEKAVANS